MTDAIVLAGGGAEPDLPSDAPNKGFLKVAGRPLVSYVVSALAGAREIGRIAVVGPPEHLRPILPDGVSVVVNEGGIMENVVRAVQALDARNLTLVAASDIPLLTSAAVEEFLQVCAAERADFYYAIVPKEAMERQFPAARKTFVHVAEGTFTGGSVMMVNPQVIDRIRPFVERVIAARKKPWLLAQLFGWSIVMKFMSGRLSIPEVVHRAAEVMGITAIPVIVRRPELALDVDMGKPENWQVIREALEKRETGDS